MTTTAENLAKNIKQLREKRGLTQQRIAELSDIPRPTWASLESGGANPTLAVLNRIAKALQVSIEELISAPKAQVKLFKAGFGPERKKHGGYLRALLPEVIPGLEISRIELTAKGQITGAPHTTGTREYLSCETGCIELIVAGERWTLEEGDAVVFRGDQQHSYINPNGRKKCVALSVVCFATS
jgi:XRE family transcriptional regulator, regulator of sulfur utilization